MLNWKDKEQEEIFRVKYVLLSFFFLRLFYVYDYKFIYKNRVLDK